MTTYQRKIVSEHPLHIHTTGKDGVILLIDKASRLCAYIHLQYVSWIFPVPGVQF